MRKVYIKDKLEEIGMPVESLSLGDFDNIGEYTAKKKRDPGSDLYNTVGCFFRPTYERGLLIYSLITKYKLTSFLEIGFGRGYSTFCAAKAFSDSGIKGKIVTVDPNFDKRLLGGLTNVFPKSWFDMIEFKEGTSLSVLSEMDDKFDFIYIDGDHTYDAVKSDWELCRDRYNNFLLFDDYHLPTKDGGPGIDCARLIDQIDDDSKELIIMDRRIFFDDRRIPDSEIDYGQVLLSKEFSEESEMIISESDHIDEWLNS